MYLSYDKRGFNYDYSYVTGCCSMGTIHHASCSPTKAKEFTANVKATAKSSRHETVMYAGRFRNADERRTMDAMIEHGWFIANNYRGNHGDEVICLMLNVNQR